MLIRKWHILVLAAVLTAPAMFAAQKDAEQPLPALDTVLKRIAERAEKEGQDELAFKQRYGYTRNKVTEYRNGDGEVKKREAKSRAVLPKPVAAAPQIDPQKPKQDVPAEGKLTTKTKVFDKSDFRLTDDVLDRFVFTIVGREMVNGRSMLIVDFKPANKKLPERNIKERFINKAAGRVWVDETDYAVAKAALHLTEQINVVGGLVGAIWKFTYSFNRERTEDGIWFTRNTTWHLEGREAFIKRTVDFEEKKTDVRKAQ